MIKQVLVFPPSESLNNLVNLESRYGQCPFFCDKELITFPNEVRDRFILIISLKWTDLWLSFLCDFSEPAKSQRCNFDLFYINKIKNIFLLFTFNVPFWCIFPPSNIMINIVCDLLDISFFLVLFVFLNLSPLFNKLIQSKTF